jgi:hypothetical protein
MKNSWIFQNVKDNVNALAPKFWQTYVQCYELNKIQQFDMLFIQTLNFLYNDIKYIKYSIQKFNLLLTTTNRFNYPTFIFKVMDINHPSCLQSYKLSNDPNKTKGLHYAIHIKIYVNQIMC